MLSHNLVLMLYTQMLYTPSELLHTQPPAVHTVQAHTHTHSRLDQQTEKTQCSAQCIFSLSLVLMLYTLMLHTLMLYTLMLYILSKLLHTQPPAVHAVQAHTSTQPADPQTEKTHCSAQCIFSLSLVLMLYTLILYTLMLCILSRLLYTHFG